MSDIDQPTLPPILYWSASLADRTNAIECCPDPRHGLIDATVESVLMHWVDFDGWCVLPELPADARRLVCEGPTQ